MPARTKQEERSGERIKSIARLRRFLLQRVRTDKKDYDSVATELQDRGVDLGKEITGFQVLSLCKGLAVHRRRGPKPSSARRVWRDEVQPNLADLSDEQKAELYRMEVIPAAKRVKRNGAMTRFAEEPANCDDYACMVDEETGEPFC